MDKLQQYLDEAEDFLLEKKSEITKQNIIWFCKKHGLDQKFEKLLEENPKWCLLAETHKVKYYVDDVPNKWGDISKDVPNISLEIFSNGTDPTIKVHVGNSDGYF